jgi:hypothetical protein
MLRNRLPVQGLGALTPYTIFFGQRPRIDNLRVWGCDAYKLEDTYPKVPGQNSRKRLIYCGETPDRLGFRCFDPIKFKYTTEYELTFDEASAKKRINAIREHDDIRRELAKRGKLDDMELEPNDQELDPDTIATERTLYSSAPSSVHQRLPQETESPKPEGGRAAEEPTPPKTNGVPSPEKNGEGKDEREQSNNNAVNELIVPPVPTTRPDSSGTNPLSQSVTEYRMGETSDQLPLQTLQLETTLETEDESKSTDCSTTPASSALTRAIRPGRVPEPRPREPRHDTTKAGIEGQTIHLTDQDEGDIAANDNEADDFGPLTEQAMALERQRSRIHPAHPRRPLRLKPMGSAEKDSDDFKAFRRFAFDNDVLIRVVEQNPKTPGSESHRRYCKYRMATTLREIVELSVSSGGVRGTKQRQVAMKDITNDSLRGFIIFPEYVNAHAVALAAHVKNFHALYSQSEACEAVHAKEQPP